MVRGYLVRGSENLRVSVFGFGVWGFRFRVWGFGFRVSGFGFEVFGEELSVECLAFRVQG